MNICLPSRPPLSRCFYFPPRYSNFSKPFLSRCTSTSTGTLGLDNDIPLEPTYNPSSPESNDPWDFLQGNRPKTVLHNVPVFRQLPINAGHHLGRTVDPFSENLFAGARPTRAESGTLCERERLVFAEIFKQILSNKAVFTQQPNSGAPFPSPSLNALFESAVGPQQSRGQISFGPHDSVDRDSTVAKLALASNFEYFSPAVRMAAAKAAGVVGSVWTSREMEEIKEQLGDKILEMNRCGTDLELGVWMEEHVFSMVSDSKPSPPGTYSYLLAEGMRILRNTFNDLQGVFSIFSRIKALGAESYVVGCSVDVYNQVIAAKWEGTRDLYKVKGLVDEMETNGIQGNTKTLRVLTEIMQDVAAVDVRKGWTHVLFSEGNEDVVDGLKEKVDVWEKPMQRGNIEETLKAMSV